MVEKTTISFEEELPSVQEMAGRIEATLPDYPYLVAEQDSRILGYAYASQHRNSFCVSLVCGCHNLCRL